MGKLLSTASIAPAMADAVLLATRITTVKKPVAKLNSSGDLVTVTLVETSVAVCQLATAFRAALIVMLLLVSPLPLASPDQPVKIYVDAPSAARDSC